MSATLIKGSFIGLGIAGLLSTFVVAYAQSGDLANCARIRVVPNQCGKKSSLAEVYVDNMHNDRMVRATIRKHSPEGDDDTDYAIAEGGKLFIACVGKDTSFTVVGCEVLKTEIEKR